MVKFNFKDCNILKIVLLFILGKKPCCNLKTITNFVTLSTYYFVELK